MYNTKRTELEHVVRAVGDYSKTEYSLRECLERVFGEGITPGNMKIRLEPY
jgi:hypothetical protein